MKTAHWLIAALISLGLLSCQQTEINENITCKSFIYPVLKGKKDNPAIRLLIEADKSTEQVLQGMAFIFSENTRENVKSLRVYATGQDSLFRKGELFGEIHPERGHMLVHGTRELASGNNYYWCTLELKENTNLDSHLEINLDYLLMDGKRQAPSEYTGTSVFRQGVALRQHRQDNVHTYRIPGLSTTNAGTLLAIYDVRREGGRDLQGDIDIGVSRSTDGGLNWEPMRLALDMGEWGGLPEKFNGVSDANILVDETTGDIFIAGLWMHGVITPEGQWVEGLSEESSEWNHQWRNKGSQPGFGVRETSQFLLTKSTDDGMTWSEPVNLTHMCKHKDWWLWAPAPGHGITLSDGTLLFPTQGRDAEGLPFSNITYSNDGGVNWITSNPAYHNTTESMAVELSDGSVMLNMRNNRNRKEKGDKNGRAIATTHDLGQTWTEHPTSCSALIEPVCMASLHRHQYKDKDGKEQSILFFSNPNSMYQRHKQTLKASFDDGKTWPEKYWIELDEGRGAGYSCITSIDENTIGVLYEGSQAQMTFQRIGLDEILAK